MSVLAQLFHTVLELAVVLGLVVVAERCRDHSSNPLILTRRPGSTWAAVRSHERPVVIRLSSKLVNRPPISRSYVLP
jgi:hypothetical protein